LAGELTLLPLLFGQGLFWSIEAVAERLPLLIGQMVAYGAVLGLSYYLLMQQVIKKMPAAAKEEPPRRKLPRPSSAFGPMSQTLVPPRRVAIMVGGISGLIGLALGFSHAGLRRPISSL
jgi:hypothetical protein